MISITSKGSFSHTDNFLRRLLKLDIMSNLERYGKKGRDALASATPIESGITAESWSYDVHHSKKGYFIIWRNSHMVEGVPVAILIQYGHSTGTGGWVQGKDFINPVIQPLFDEIADSIWKEVSRDV